MGRLCCGSRIPGIRPNREIARDRLAELVAKALVVPKRRVATKPTKGSVRRRLAGKAQRGALKAARGRVTDEE